MPLNARQKEAVEYLEGPLLVVAGPGTGKTQLLSSKVAYILEKTEAAPNNILCLTFTESAASNMRNRLLSMIGPAANDVHIYTYHSFGKYILAAYQNFNQQAPRFFEEAIDPVMAYWVVDKIKESLDPYDPLRKNSTRDILDTISSVKSARLSAEDLKKIYEQNEAVISEINQTVAPILEEAYARIKFEDGVVVYKKALEALDEINKKYEKIKQILPLSEVLFNELRKAFIAIDPEKPKIAPFSKWRTDFFKKDEHGWYKLSTEVAEMKLKSLYSLIIA